MKFQNKEDKEKILQVTRKKKTGPRPKVWNRMAVEFCGNSGCQKTKSAAT